MLFFILYKIRENMDDKINALQNFSLSFDSRFLKNKTKPTLPVQTTWFFLLFNSTSWIFLVKFECTAFPLCLYFSSLEKRIYLYIQLHCRCLCVFKNVPVSQRSICLSIYCKTLSPSYIISNQLVYIYIYIIIYIYCLKSECMVLRMF